MDTDEDVRIVIPAHVAALLQRKRIIRFSGQRHFHALRPQHGGHLLRQHQRDLLFRKAAVVQRRARHIKSPVPRVQHHFCPGQRRGLFFDGDDHVSVDVAGYACPVKARGILQRQPQDGVPRRARRHLSGGNRGGVAEGKRFGPIDAFGVMKDQVKVLRGKGIDIIGKIPVPFPVRLGGQRKGNGGGPVRTEGKHRSAFLVPRGQAGYRIIRQGEGVDQQRGGTGEHGYAALQLIAQALAIAGDRLHVVQRSGGQVRVVGMIGIVVAGGSHGGRGVLLHPTHQRAPLAVIPVGRGVAPRLGIADLFHRQRNTVLPAAQRQDVASLRQQKGDGKRTAVGVHHRAAADQPGACPGGAAQRHGAVIRGHRAGGNGKALIVLIIADFGDPVRGGGAVPQQRGVPIDPAAEILLPVHKGDLRGDLIGGVGAARDPIHGQQAVKGNGGTGGRDAVPPGHGRFKRNGRVRGQTGRGRADEIKRLRLQKRRKRLRLLPLWQG